jgi:FtsP/CotA-like multicopper oxidase with cupredoxin domain
MNYPNSTLRIVASPRVRALRAVAMALASRSPRYFGGGVARRRLGASQKLIAFVALAVGLLLSSPLHAATPGITDTTFNLVAAPASITQPDGVAIYSWGYGCANTYTTYTFMPSGVTTGAFCPTMQVPGPTLILTEGKTYIVNLTNNLPAGAGNASMVFPGLQVVATCYLGATNCVQGLQTLEATPGNIVTYTITASAPGTRAYYSGTQPDLQIEMGLYGATVVIPNTVPPGCISVGPGKDVGQSLGGLTSDFRLAASAYDHPGTCYDREYLFQWMELDPVIHRQAEEQVQTIASCTNSASTPTCPTLLNVKTEPWHPRYFMINGRSMPDNMDPDYAPNYPHQPYNGNPHMHPGDLTLVRTIGQGRWMHPFHEHGNHVRILARDGNLILSENDPAATNTVLPRLAGRMEFTTDTYPGQAYDGIFYWSGKGLGWDIYGHAPGTSGNPPCIPDKNGFYTSDVTARNYYEWCGDHNHPLEANPVGQIGAGGPATQFDPLVATNGLWYNGTPYLGPDAVINNRGNTPLVPATASQNPLPESGIAFMWHSHNEREITTNDVFPGGMLMMMLVDPPVWPINEAL